jgi:exopolysaccharide biosynthesis WecB/TagA/CpsF family protein
VTTANFKSGDPLIRKLCLLEEEELTSLFDEICKVTSPTTLGFLNQHGYNIAQKHPLMHKYLDQMKYLLRDGVGVKMACKANGRDPKANLNGTDLIPQLVQHLDEHAPRECQFFSMGTREPWVTQGSEKLYGGKPFHAIDGFQKNDVYLEFFRQHYQPGKLAVITLAMGMPRQEELAAFFRRELDVPCVMICGGAILDFCADRFARAPYFFRKFGLEWLYRLLMEPRRLFKRYAIGIPLFVYYVLRNSSNQDMGIGKESMANHRDR